MNNDELKNMINFPAVRDISFISFCMMK